MRFYLIRLILVFRLLLLSVSAYAQEPDTTVYQFVDVDAEFPGGDFALMHWFNQHLEISITTGEMPSGRGAISFIVELDGSITDVKIHRDSPLSQAAVACAQDMPCWIPAVYNHKRCRSVFVLPFNIHYE
jgi:protein TonB